MASYIDVSWEFVCVRVHCDVPLSMTSKYAVGAFLRVIVPWSRGEPITPNKEFFESKTISRLNW